MPNEKGMFTQDETDEQYSFSYPLARFIGKYFPKDKPVIDLGCGRGSYLSYLEDVGFKYLSGVEGIHQHKEFTGKIENKDLTQEIDLGYQGNVICLEVGEHIPEKHLGVFYDNICRHVAHGCKIVLSHAIRLQGGLGHVSCKDNMWVQREMEKRGFELLIDDSIAARNVIESKNCHWFQNSLIIFKKVK